MADSGPERQQARGAHLRVPYVRKAVAKLAGPHGRLFLRAQPLTWKAVMAQMMADTETKELVGYEARDGVAILTLDDPPANTYTYELMQDLDRQILRARMDESVYVILLIGGGEKFFCAGANISMLNSVTPEFKYYFCLHANETLNRLEQTPKLVIAALNGHTVGGGLEIAMAADMRIARRGGGKIGLPEVNLGVLPGTGGTQRLCRIVGKSSAIELMVTGRTFEYDEAKQLGIVNDIYDAPDRETFLSQVMEYAKQFTPPNMASRAIGNIKRSVQTGAELPFQDALALERELQQQLFASQDAKEGIASYVEKRKAQFKAR
jgi:enoyl-CoA hydratase